MNVIKGGLKLNKYLIRYRDEFGIYYLPIYEVTANEAVRRFRDAMDDETVVDAVFVEVGDWE